MRVAFVGYRDIGDDVRFDIKDFTGDAEEVKAKIKE